MQTARAVKSWGRSGTGTLGWFVAVGAVLAISCASPFGGAGPCDGLVYKEHGLNRLEYLPCAGEMIATMGRIRPELSAALAGDRSAESRARNMLVNLSGLIKKAGGRNLLERWEDQSLTSLNVDIWNAYSHYQAGLMVPVVAAGHPGEAAANEAREDEFRRGNDVAERAKRLYERLR